VKADGLEAAWGAEYVSGRVRHGGEWLRSLRAAAVRAVRRYIYRSHRFLVMRTVLAGPPVAAAVGDVVFRLATPSDLEGLEELERYGRASRHRRLVRDDNDWLFVACHGDRVVATRRYSRALPPVSRDGHGLMSRLLELGHAHVWAADTFCLPEYRNQGIGRLLGLYAMRALAALGYTENFGTIAIGNGPSLRMARRQGSQPLYYVSYVRVLWYERLRVSRKLPKHVEDVAGVAESASEVGDDVPR